MTDKDKETERPRNTKTETETQKRRKCVTEKPRHVILARPELYVFEDIKDFCMSAADPKDINDFYMWSTSEGPAAKQVCIAPNILVVK